MKIHPTILSGLFICLALVVIFGFTIIRTVAQKPATVTNTAAGTQLSQSIFSSKVFNDLQQKSVNGPLPVIVNAEDLGHANPFQ